MQIVKNMKRSKIITLINNATFSQTVTSADISVGEYRNFLIQVHTGTKTNSPTMDIVIQIKDSNGNYVTHTQLLQIAAAGDVYDEMFDNGAQTIRVVATYGGSGNFANVTLELTAYN